MALFTGIVQGVAEVRELALNAAGDAARLVVRFPPGAIDGVAVGASVAVNGTCLTVVSADEAAAEARFDLVVETLRATNLGSLAAGSRVNFERSARYGDEVGGHAVSGHVHAVAEVVAVEETEDNRRVLFKVPEHIMKYVLPKGFVAVDGCSLTVGETTADTFSVYLIPETLRQTCFLDRVVGTGVNVEVEQQTQAIVDTVERVLAERGT